MQYKTLKVQKLIIHSGNLYIIQKFKNLWVLNLSFKSYHYSSILRHIIPYLSVVRRTEHFGINTAFITIAMLYSYKVLLSNMN